MGSFTELTSAGSGILESVAFKEAPARRYEAEEEIAALLRGVPRLSSLVMRNGYEVAYAETKPIRLPPEYVVTSEEALMHVARADTPDEIGMHGPVMAAWTPAVVEERIFSLYNDAFFPRDAMITGEFVEHRHPKLMRATLLECARLQGKIYNPWAEELPGKIPHEVRNADNPIAQEIVENSHWGLPYFGATDNTSSFVRHVMEYTEMFDNRFLKTPLYDNQRDSPIMGDAVSSAVEYLKREMDKSDHGLVEFQSMHPEGKGLQNQGWRDSWDGYIDITGRQANHDKPIADLATQVDTYTALQKVIQHFPDRVEELTSYVQHLREQIFREFWVDDSAGGYFALGTDRDEEGNLRKLDALTSNTGFVLGSDLLAGDDPQIVSMRESVIQRLFSPEMLNWAGIRTLASDHPLFHPDAYHNGTVWLWYTAVIANYLDSLGYNGLATVLQEKVIRSNRENKFFFEYYRGDDAREPTVCITVIDVKAKDDTVFRAVQPPQPFQAWTIGADIYAHDALEAKRNGLTPRIATDFQKRRFEKEILENVFGKVHDQYDSLAA